MYVESRKLRIVEKILAIRNDQVLKEVEDFIQKLKNPENEQKQSAREFAGILSIEDAILMEKAIEEGCEEINPDDWK